MEGWKCNVSACEQQSTKHSFPPELMTETFGSDCPDEWVFAETLRCSESGDELGDRLWAHCVLVALSVCLSKEDDYRTRSFRFLSCQKLGWGTPSGLIAPWKKEKDLVKKRICLLRYFHSYFECSYTSISCQDEPMDSHTKKSFFLGYEFFLLLLIGTDYLRNKPVCVWNSYDTFLPK